MPPIFISHSSRDNAVAAVLKARLAGIGHRSVFLDFDPEDGIPAGREWELELYTRIRSCQAMVVICSQASMSSRWCFMEITHARALGKPLFAMKVEDCQLDGVLADRQAIDMRAGEEQAYAQLLRGLTIAGLDPANAFPWERTRPPYPGMLAFEESDAAVFFGRGDEVARGLELLNRVHRLGEPLTVMVLGGSGTGKSSLVRAGLVPRLRRDPERWLIVDTIRPRTDPVRELATAIGCAFEQTGASRSVALIAKALTDGPNGLTDVLMEMRSRCGRPNAKVLLVIDQFEELLTTEKDRESAVAVLRALRRASEHGDRTIVILGTMRSDFLDRFQNHPEILDLRYEAISLGPMSQEDVTEIVEAPAREANLELEPELVSALVAEGTTPNALPLLAFTLRELWERYGKDGKLTLSEYRDGLGGLQMVVGRVAEEVIATENLTEAREQTLGAAFTAMLRISGDGKYVRRVRNWSDFPVSVQPLLERFVHARLLATSMDGGNRTLEVAHEHLFGSWDRLGRWISEFAEALRLGVDIEAAAGSWDAAVRSGADGGEYLWRGARAARARELLVAGKLLLDAPERRFIDASQAAEELEVGRRERQRKRQLLAVSIIAAIAVASALIAGNMALRARSSAVAAEERARIAEIARARALAAQNFAENQRVTARAKEAGVGADVRQALEVIAPKYLDQSKRYEATAQRLQQALEEWRGRKQATVEPPKTLFSLEAFRAGSGTAFLIHYGQPGAPRHILIDGGKDETFKKILLPRFEQLRRIHASQPVLLDLVVASQTDIQHMGGLISLIKALKQPGAAPYKVSTLWSNAFLPDDDEYDEEMAQPGERPPRRFVELQPKAELVFDANALGIPVNRPFSSLVMRPEAGAARMSWEEGLSITVLSPPLERVQKFAKFWLREWRRRPRDNRSQQVSVDDESDDYAIEEDFASPSIELLPSPFDVVNPPSTGGSSDMSVPNLASIVSMLELGGKRMLLTADARSDLLLASLAQAGYTDDRGAMDVDLLVIPHGGSDRSVSEDFFRRVRARYYVISSDGEYRNPEIATMKMLFDGRRSDPRPFTIVLTYTPAEMAERQQYPAQELCRFFADERGRGSLFDVIAPRKTDVSVAIDLLSSVTFAPKGSSGVCP